MKTFILYWRTGDIDVVKGESFADACNKAGWGPGAMNALDFAEESRFPTYKWNAKQRKFIKLSTYELYRARYKRTNVGEVMHRARCILGLKGIRNAEELSLNLSSVRYLPGLAEYNDDEFATMAKRVVDDTLAWM